MKHFLLAAALTLVGGDTDSRGREPARGKSR